MTNNEPSPLLTIAGTRLTLRRLLLLLLTVTALGVRFVNLDSVPPGWRDDELINSLVISQKVLDGDLAVYYADASGHEALYHALNAVFLAMFGPGVPGIRWLSVLLGTLTVPLIYLLGKRLWSPAVGLVAAAGLTFSFWSLIYSRIGLRHILLPPLVLAAFYFFWQPLAQEGEGRNRWSLPLAAFFMALGFYTYFAGRGVPLIVLTFIGYILVTDPTRFRRLWRGWALFFGIALVLALPLVITLQQQPEAEGRVAELAVPLVAAGDGDFEPLLHHVRVTLSMFHSDGDDEWLYNIPHRPVFGPIGALFLWAGVALAAWQAVLPVIGKLLSVIGKRSASQQPPITGHRLPATDHRSPITGHRLPATDHRLPITDHRLPITGHASAFLLLWWLAGISPAFISVPPASLGHTILAQPATYLLAALPVWWMAQRSSREQSMLPTILGILLVASIAVRDLPDYFVEWPQRGMVRFLYRSDIHDVADYLNETPALGDFGITGLLAGPWDKLALATDLAAPTAVSPRWFNPERALILEPARSFVGWPNVNMAYADWVTPAGVTQGEYELVEVIRAPARGEITCFANGLCLVTAAYQAQSGKLELGWQVRSLLELPTKPLISNPPPPGVYSGPRLQVFAQLWDNADAFIAGDDGLWVDPYTLQVGDLFIQQHWPLVPEGAAPATAVVGLYDPLTGTRILTNDGRDHVRFEVGN